MILNRKNPSLGPGFGTMYTVSVEPMGCLFTESDNWGGIEGEFKAIVYLVKICIRAALVCKFNTLAVTVRRQDLFDIRNRAIFACVPNRYTHLNINYHVRA
jgi:hypothetical protein